MPAQPGTPRKRAIKAAKPKSATPKTSVKARSNASTPKTPGKRPDKGAKETPSKPTTSKQDQTTTVFNNSASTPDTDTESSGSVKTIPYSEVQLENKPDSVSENADSVSISTNSTRKHALTSEHEPRSKRPCSFPVSPFPSIIPEVESLSRKFNDQDLMVARISRENTELKATMERMRQIGNSKFQQQAKEHLQTKTAKKAVEEELKKLKCEQQHLQGVTVELFHAKSEKKEIEEELKKLKMQQQRLQDETAEFNNDYARLLDERQYEPANFAKVSDDEVLRLWKNKAYNIRQLSFHILTANFTIRDVPLDLEGRESVLTLRKDCAECPDFKPYFLQQFIWLELCEKIYWGGKNVWGGPVGKSFLKWSNELNGYWHKYPRELSLMRSQGAQILDEVFIKIGSTDMQAEIVEELRKKFDSFIPKSKMQDFQGEMGKIVNQALQLHRIFLKSRAIFEVEYPLESGEEYPDYETMAVQFCFGTREKPTVDTITSPFLTKHGTADGFNFERSFVLCKADVVLY